MFWSSLGYMVPGKAQRRCMNTRSRLALCMDVQEPLPMPRCQDSFSHVPICSISHIVTPQSHHQKCCSPITLSKASLAVMAIQSWASLQHKRAAEPRRWHSGASEMAGRRSPGAWELSCLFSRFLHIKFQEGASRER